MVLPCENGSKVPNAWQPMSAETCGSPMSRLASFIAANTGRSGQPTQNVGGLGGNGASSRLPARARAALTVSSQRMPPAVSRCGA